MKNFSQKVLLHCCCAPCSVSVVKNLREINIEPDLFWYNPNIHPYTEYIERRDCLKNFAQNENLKILKPENDEYGLRFFLKEVSSDFDNRCKQCYRMRLEKTASFAAIEGYDSFSTTLLISPYQDHDAIKKIGEELANKYKIEFLYKDFRPFFREGQAQAREKKFYMQKYCGCVFSEEERYIKNISRRDAGSQRTQRFKKEEQSFSAPSSLHSSSPRSPRLRESSFSRISLLVGEEKLEKLKKHQRACVRRGRGRQLGGGSPCTQRYRKNRHY